MLENYLKITWKVLGRNKFFTFVSLFGITFTIGILLVLTTFYDNMLGPGYPEVNRERTLLLHQVSMHTDDFSSNTMNPASLHFILNYVKHLKTPKRFSFASTGEETTTFIGDKKLALYLKLTSSTFWETNEFEFLEGQGYTEQQVNDIQPLAVITETTKDEYFGTKQSVVGQTIETGNKRYTVIGVVRDVPGNFVYAYADIYVPYSTSHVNVSEQKFTGNYVASIQAERASDFPKIKEEFAALMDRLTLPEDWEYTIIRAQPFTPLEIISSAFARRGEDPPVGLLRSLLFGAMFLFMLLPALNLINLNSSRILERASEIGVRKAFGASSKTLAIQFIVENVILTVLGGILGLLFSFSLLTWIESAELLPIPHLTLHFDYKVFLIALALCVFFGVLSGVLPALRMSKLHIVHALKGQHL